MRNLIPHCVILCCLINLSITSIGSATPNEHLLHAHAAANSPVATAPTWSLKDATQQVLSSGDFAGRPYVLILHKGHGCLHCAEQLKTFGDQSNSFKEFGVDIVGVSTDNTAGLVKSLAEYGEKFPLEHLVADSSLDVFKQFHAYDEEANEPLHGTFLIDGAGRIRWSNISSHPFMNYETLLSEVSLVSTGATTQQEDERKDRPKVFLDKSPRIVAYQLKRLNNEALLRVERKTDDKKYVPVFYAILTRDGMSPQYREEALAGLTTLNESSSAKELLTALGKMKADNRQQKQTTLELSGLLLRQPGESLAKETGAIIEATQSDNSVLRSASFATLMMVGKKETALEIAKTDPAKTLDCLGAISLIPDKKMRSTLLNEVVAFSSDKNETPIRRAAIKAMRAIPSEKAKAFSLLAPLVTNTDLRDVAIGTMLKVPTDQRNAADSKNIVDSLVKFAETTPADKRTSNKFIDAMQLTDELLVKLPLDDSKSYRDRLDKVTVRVVKILTVEEEMRYDVPFFAVEAGRPIQVVLQNEDLMGHNLVVCMPGKLKQVANDAMDASPDNEKKNRFEGKQYVPKTDDVLFATEMIGAHSQGRITFDAPTEPGEYPYVCTFPNHWPRMYGVMVVVNDLNAWMQNPIEPKDPIGSDRKFVEKWTVETLAGELEAGTKGRTMEIGKKIFTEATCLQCHKMGSGDAEGGAVGPALDEVFARWKGDKTAVLREILDPSHRIDEKYSMHMILTMDGVTMSGIIQSQNDEIVEIIDNPTAIETTKILKDDIDEMVKTSKSIMPKALMDNFSKDEIFELFNYIESSQKK